MATQVSGVEREFEGVGLGDRRREQRLRAIVARMSKAPSSSFPRALVTEAEREGAYRFLASEHVSWQQILQPHFAASRQRCQAAKVVRVAHDTSFLSFEGDREGLGPIAGRKRGFGAHASLAVTVDETRTPLGLLALSAFARADKPKRRTKEAKVAQTLENRARPRADKESSRWEQQAMDVSRWLGDDVECIHVMDQEADDYALLAELRRAGLRFVIRGSAARQIDKRQGEKVADRLAEETHKLVLEVPVGPRRKPSPNHRVRAGRLAALQVRATTVVLPRPQYAQHDEPDLVLNVVQVFEPHPPPNEPPIVWTLYTSEPVVTADHLRAVVDHYRARWRIEEYFKALKTGCAIEKRQLESYDALLRALAILAPIAWRLLLLRSAARQHDTSPVTDLFDDIQIAVVNHLAERQILHRSGTIRDAYLAIARLAGHIKNNGEPGWSILGAGFERFAAAESTWRAALAARTI